MNKELEMTRINFGVHLATHGLYDYEAFIKTALLADSLGYDYITIGDHFFTVPESAGGDPKKPYKLDAFTSLAALAAQTSKAKIGIRVSPLPFYQPARLAKMLTTIDIISKGRVIFGVGAGASSGWWYKNNEFYRSGVGWFNPKERIGRMRESIQIILKLWSEDSASFRGKYYTISNMPSWPKPIQKPHPPIWFGGGGNGLLNATAKYGVGIFPYPGMAIDELKNFNRRMKIAEEKQRRKDHIILAPSMIYPDAEDNSLTRWSEKIEELRDIGASLVMIDFSQRAVKPGEAQEFIKGFTDSFSKFNC